MTKKILLGAHMSIAGGAHRAIERACSINCSAMQIFVKNNMQWFARPLSTGEIRAFLDHQQRAQLASVFAHANYLINLAATNPQFHANSLRALAEELIRADHLGLPFLVMHPGAHLGAGEEAGLEKITASIDAIWRLIPKVKTKIALLDTAHIFAAGYDIGSENAAKKTFRKFDRIIPQARDRLVAIHLNDSKAARGSRVDRHAHIGKGKIGLAAFRFIMNAPRFGKIPKVLETPKGKELKEDVVNLRTLRRLIASPTPSSRAQARDLTNFG
jgi:deoxyribonuclease IV